MTEETLSAYRTLLTQYEPFAGVTTYGPGLRPQTFATTRQGTTYLGVLNRSATARPIAVPLAEHGLTMSRPATAYDVEAGRFIRLSNPFTVTMPAQSLGLYIVRQSPGVMWTNSSFSTVQSGRRLTITLKGPSGLPGFAHVLSGRPIRVQIDGKASAFTYDAPTSVLSIAYDNQPQGRVLIIDY
jgi:hypothetical protein